jgi:hypothetical protein
MVQVERRMRSDFDVPWSELCRCVAETFRFTAAEVEAFAENRTARLIGTIPFAAGCEEPERTALAHLALYVTELRGGNGIGGHGRGDDRSLFARLRLLSSFIGGDQEIIRHGMNYLALIMLVGYERSRSADDRNGVYNPLNDGSWDGAELKAGLINAIEAYPCALLDGIFYSAEGVIPLW